MTSQHPAPPNPAPPSGPTTSAHPGPERTIHAGIVRASIAATAVHLISTVLGVATDASAVRNGVAVVSVVLFFAGSVTFMVAFVVAAGRSRYEELWFGGAFFLTGGVAHPSARKTLFACLILQCVIGLVGASLAPFTPVAFSVLVPMSAMGLMAFYGARWGEFSPKAEGE